MPLLLLVNGTMGAYYKDRASRGEETWGPFCLHLVGTCLALYMTLFEKGMLPFGPNGDGDLVDPQWIFYGKNVNPPPVLQGGVWHHGPFFAFTAVSGLGCVLVASVWSATQGAKGKGSSSASSARSD